MHGCTGFRNPLISHGYGRSSAATLRGLVHAEASNGSATLGKATWNMVYFGIMVEVDVVDWMTDLVERELSLDSGLSPSEKGLYIAIKTLRPNSLVELARHAGLSHSSVSRACAGLASRGWVRIEVSSRGKCVSVAVPEVVQARQAELLREIYSMQPYKGEFLLKVLLDAFVLSRKYVENARPRWLINPTTGESMEVDRLYLPEDDDPFDCGNGGFGDPRTATGKGNSRMASGEGDSYGFEFHGPQHFGPTKAYPDVEEFRKTQARDLMKKAICADNGVRLVVVTYKELSPKGILKRIPKTLATCQTADLRGRYLTTVGELCANYRANARDLW